MGTYPKMTQILDLAEEVLKLLSLLKDTKDIMLIVNKRMNKKSWQRNRNYKKNQVQTLELKNITSEIKIFFYLGITAD